jgi:hypothetical protein
VIDWCGACATGLVGAQVCPCSFTTQPAIFVLQQFVYCPSSQYILFSRERICKLACTLAFEWKWKPDCHGTFWWLSECFLCMPTEFLALHQDVKHELCNTAQRDGVAVCKIWQNFLSRNLKWTNMVLKRTCWLNCAVTVVVVAQVQTRWFPTLFSKLGVKYLNLCMWTDEHLYPSWYAPFVQSSNRWNKWLIG